MTILLTKVTKTLVSPSLRLKLIQHELYWTVNYEDFLIEDKLQTGELGKPLDDSEPSKWFIFLLSFGLVFKRVLFTDGDCIIRQIIVMPSMRVYSPSLVMYFIPSHLCLAVDHHHHRLTNVLEWLWIHKWAWMQNKTCLRNIDLDITQT